MHGEGCLLVHGEGVYWCTVRVSTGAQCHTLSIKTSYTHIPSFTPSPSFPPSPSVALTGGLGFCSWRMVSFNTCTQVSFSSEDCPGRERGREGGERERGRGRECTCAVCVQCSQRWFSTLEVIGLVACAYCKGALVLLVNANHCMLHHREDSAQGQRGEER